MCTDLNQLLSVSCLFYTTILANGRQILSFVYKTDMKPLAMFIALKKDYVNLKLIRVSLSS